MSYYDFDRHFWSPETVCIQSAPSKSAREGERQTILKTSLAIACITVWTPLLLQILNPGTVNSQGSYLSNNAAVNCVVLSGDRVQVYCSNK